MRYLTQVCDRLTGERQRLVGSPPKDAAGLRDAHRSVTHRPRDRLGPPAPPHSPTSASPRPRQGAPTRPGPCRPLACSVAAEGRSLAVRVPGLGVPWGVPWVPFLACPAPTSQTRPGDPAGARHGMCAGPVSLTGGSGWSRGHRQWWQSPALADSCCPRAARHTAPQWDWAWSARGTGLQHRGRCGAHPRGGHCPRRRLLGAPRRRCWGNSCDRLAEAAVSQQVGSEHG